MSQIPHESCPLHQDGGRQTVPAHAVPQAHDRVDPLRGDIGDLVRALGIPHGFYDEDIPTTEASVVHDYLQRVAARRAGNPI